MDEDHDHQLTPRRRPHASEFVAEQLRREIMLGLVTPGDSLPTERELTRQLRVGRSTVQRALTQLKNEGLIERRRGRSGGSIVRGAAEVNPSLSEAMRSTLCPMKGAIGEALAFRLDVEPTVCGLAARFASAADVASIRSAAQAVRVAEDDAHFMLADTQFHLAIVGAVHNRFYWEALHNMRTVLDEALAALPESELWHRRSHDEHDRIIAAIKSHDEFVAHQVMREHVAATDVFVRALLEVL